MKMCICVFMEVGGDVNVMDGMGVMTNRNIIKVLCENDLKIILSESELFYIV